MENLHAVVRASVVAAISSSGLGFSRAAGLGLNIAGGTDVASEPAAENRAVDLEVSVGPNATSARERIIFESESGLGSINDSRLNLRVVAVYREVVR
jgi:hypothetical protein